MTDIKLLPLPEWMSTFIVPDEGKEVGCDHRLSALMKDYARANVAHATAAKDAEIERLRVDVEAWKASHSLLTDTCHHFQARAERLAEVLREAFEWADRELEGTDALYPAWMDQAYAVLRQQGANHD